MTDERELMIAAAARVLDPDNASPAATRELAAQVLEEAMDAARGSPAGPPPSWQPDLSDPGQALARRVQEALEREFDGEELFPCVVVVQENRTRRVGMAATAIGMNDVVHLLTLGRGAAMRVIREQGERQ